MINQFKIFSAAVISILAVSCSQNKEIKPTYIEEASANTQEVAPNSPSIVATNPEAVVNGGQVSAPVAAANPQPQKVAPGMNPAHGEPGHRCDISVGAPLNSPVATPAAAPQVMPQTVNPTPQSAPVANPMNLAVNPAHGEAGHSCAIAVGAPFK
ncbi:hypothetical protein [Frigoriflavimonas asaccharolytica]|uniref:Uncharacterized protein n=1 Tax=Frigoriflavimonas asaccharolytica TaxID=2735899 RepID=A0A8J8K6Z8_9FLAO|nr:hypothetical protein [Frigoriflavimonas asaccharolytica]NRS90991.1 hypothetical protein [Frigoriflavimonas asaccharolytica]